MALYLNNWKKLTFDPEVLTIITGDTIEFEGIPPVSHIARSLTLSSRDKKLLDTEVHGLLKKGVIVQCTHEEVEYVSPVFPVSNSDGSVRMILNLKSLNNHITYHHFKMETIHTVLQNITPGCFMASLDLKSAYYSVPISQEYQKFLKFEWDNVLYKFVCFPNGLSPCPRKFTKITKAPLSSLREDDAIVSGYIDDFHIQGSDYRTCELNLIKTINMFDGLGFVIHPEKSAFIPKQEVKYLGFLINSIEMTISLTQEKRDKLYSLISKLLTVDVIQIRTVASVLGKIISSLPASSFGALYYRNLETNKIDALKKSRGNFDAFMTLTVGAKADLMWWRKNLHTMFAPIHLPPISLTLKCDASDTGWGAISQGMSTGGAWSPHEKDLHINCKEMLAIYFSLRSFCAHFHGLHIRVLSDNTTAISVLNKMGTVRSQQWNLIAQTVWQFCRDNKIWITCAHIPGKLNTEADTESRKEYKQAEWMLNSDIFEKAVQRFNFIPDLDCFASRINSQIPRYVSRMPDPYASFIDSFSINWSHFKCYIFPPFSLISRVLQKLRVDRATALCVFPRWTTQPWWPLLQFMMVGEPWVLKPKRNHLVLPQSPEDIHPLAHKMSLVLCKVSGDASPEKLMKQQLTF